MKKKIIKNELKIKKLNKAGLSSSELYMIIQSLSINAGIVFGRSYRIWEENINF